MKKRARSSKGTSLLDGSLDGLSPRDKWWTNAFPVGHVIHHNPWGPTDYVKVLAHRTSDSGPYYPAVEIAYPDGRVRVFGRESAPLFRATKEMQGEKGEELWGALVVAAKVEAIS